MRHQQRNLEGGSLALGALDADEPAVLFDDSIADREGETGTAILCGKERGEDVGQVFLFDSHSLVPDVYPVQPASIASFTAYMATAFQRRRDSQSTASVHRLKGIFHQVEKNLCQLCSVAADRGQAGIEMFLNRDA